MLFSVNCREAISATKRSVSPRLYGTYDVRVVVKRAEGGWGASPMAHRKPRAHLNPNVPLQRPLPVDRSQRNGGLRPREVNLSTTGRNDFIEESGRGM